MQVVITFGALPDLWRRNPQLLVDQITYPAILEGTEYLRGRLVLATPSGATGKARQSLYSSTSSGLFGTIEGHVDYAEPASGYIAFADQGTRPHWPPYQPIAYWARRVLFTDNPRVVIGIQRAIARRGTRAQRFVESTARIYGDEAVQIVAGAIARAAARLGL